MSDKHFYKKLPSLKISVTEVLQSRNFTDMPPDWYVVISDIKNSTEAINEGRHNDVNLVAAGSLIAALNIARETEIEIPFFFGGDGGTLLVPEAIWPQVMDGLQAHNNNSRATLGIEMHVGSMKVQNITNSGHFLKIAKTQLGGFNKAIVIGDGLQYAEQIIKQDIGNKAPMQTVELDLTGLQCRWDRIKAATEQTEIVCYLIEASEPLQQIAVYQEIMMEIDSITEAFKQEIHFRCIA